MPARTVRMADLARITLATMFRTVAARSLATNRNMMIQHSPTTTVNLRTTNEQMENLTIAGLPQAKFLEVVVVVCSVIGLMWAGCWVGRTFGTWEAFVLELLNKWRR